MGDAVLELIVSEYLFYQYPEMSEGALTRTRARMVCEPSLATFAKELDFGQYLRLGKGEELTGGRTRPSLLADVFEAFMGALYLDQGLDVAKQFLHKQVFPKIDDQMAFTNHGCEESTSRVNPTRTAWRARLSNCGY